MEIVACVGTQASDARARLLPPPALMDIRGGIVSLGSLTVHVRGGLSVGGLEKGCGSPVPGRRLAVHGGEVSMGLLAALSRNVRRLLGCCDVCRSRPLPGHKPRQAQSHRLGAWPARRPRTDAASSGGEDIRPVSSESGRCHPRRGASVANPDPATLLA